MLKIEHQRPKSFGPWKRCDPHGRKVRTAVDQQGCEKSARIDQCDYVLVRGIVGGHTRLDKGTCFGDKRDDILRSLAAGENDLTQVGADDSVNRGSARRTGGGTGVIKRKSMEIWKCSKNGGTSAFNIAKLVQSYGSQGLPVLELCSAGEIDSRKLQLFQRELRESIPELG
jgi:hypothetical protein